MINAIISKYRNITTASAVLMVALCLMFSAGAQAQSEAVPAETQNENTQLASSNWTVACQPNAQTQEMVCELSQTVTLQQSNQLFMRISIGGVPKRIVLQLPHGLDIMAGIVLTVDEKSRHALAYSTSTQNGIFANIELPLTLLEAMKRGSQMEVKISAAAGNDLSIPISLAGFLIAFDKLN